MTFFKKIWTVMLAAFLIVMVIGANIVQFHHHDENCNVCLCLNPLSRCHDDDHHDCNHQEDEDCGLHIEDSIVTDKFGASSIDLSIPMALLIPKS